MKYQVNEQDKEKIIAILAALFPDSKIYLYGSRARGMSSKWSDIDLAIDAKEPIHFAKIGEANDVMSELNIPYKVDVVDFHSVTDEMRKEILRDRIVWKD